MTKYHIVDIHCRIIGGEDYGTVSTYEEAEAAIIKRKEQGYRGGCRCSGTGWKIMTCEERHEFLNSHQSAYWFVTLNDTPHFCQKYEETSKSFDEQMAESDKINISDLYMTDDNKEKEERPYRLIPKDEIISNYTTAPDKLATIIKIDKFIKSCEGGYFIDYDGFGYPMKDGLTDETIVIKPSELEKIPKDATHIIWYNR